MATLDWDLATADEVTLVHAAVRTETRLAVRITNELDGPVWPPRTQGRPAPGWRDDGYVGVSEPETPLVVGYASPAPPTEPPVSLESAPAPGEDDGTGAAAAVSTGAASTGGAGAAAATAVVRALGPAGPPRSAVPQIAAVTSRSSADDETETDRDETEAADPDRASGPPNAVTDWLDDIAARMVRHEEARAAGARADLEAVRARCDGLLDRIHGRAEPADRPARER